MVSHAPWFTCEVPFLKRWIVQNSPEMYNNRIYSFFSGLAGPPKMTNLQHPVGIIYETASNYTLPCWSSLKEAINEAALLHSHWSRSADVPCMPLTSPCSWWLAFWFQMRSFQGLCLTGVLNIRVLTQLRWKAAECGGDAETILCTPEQRWQASGGTDKRAVAERSLDYFTKRNVLINCILLK